MLKTDPLLDFSVALMTSEFPNIESSTGSTVRSWIERFIDGRLSYPEMRGLVLERCGSVNFVEKIQEILAVRPSRSC
jgi:hypothetical protein